MALPPVAARPVTDLVRCILAPNPGPMTLEGTNSYLIGRPGAGTVVVDPGPDDERHLAALAAAGDIELILITHRHPDHTDGAARLRAMTGAPVRAADAAYCHGGGPALDRPEHILAAGVLIDVLPTPGHTDDSVSFHLPGDGAGGSVLTGDTILGRGTTVIAHPDGNVGDYLTSLDVLQALGSCRVLPAHGPQRDDLAELCREYRTHRLQRLDQIRAALAGLGGGATVDQVVAAVYTDIAPEVRPAARRSVAAQLQYLRREKTSGKTTAG